MCGSMADIQSATAEIRREKKKERRKMKQDKNIMSASAIRREAIIRCYYYTGLVFPSLHGLFTRATLDSAFISCRRVSVCLSVTSRCSTEMAKRIGSHNTTRWPRDSSFLMPKISSKLKQGHPQRRRQMYRWGRLMRVR